MKENVWFATDTGMERNTLMAQVYPKIKDYCREKHGLEFQVSLNITTSMTRVTDLYTCRDRWWIWDGEWETRQRTITWPQNCVWEKSRTANVSLWDQTLWWVLNLVWIHSIYSVAQCVTCTYFLPFFFFNFKKVVFVKIHKYKYILRSHIKYLRTYIFILIK
jgi:hypothetical protein